MSVRPKYIFLSLRIKSLLSFRKSGTQTSISISEAFFTSSFISLCGSTLSLANLRYEAKKTFGK